MNTQPERPTPITDAAAFNIPHHGAEGTGLRVTVVHYQVARDLELLLAEAREDLEFRRGLYRAQTELLDTTIAERDSLRECVYRCHDAIGESRGSDHTELFKYFDGHAALVARVAKVEEQRDRLAEAVRELMDGGLAGPMPHAYDMAKSALAAMKGGES